MKVLMHLLLHWPVHMHLCCRHVVAVGKVQMLRIVGRPRLESVQMSLSAELFQPLNESFPIFLLLIGQPRVGVEIVVVEPYPPLRLLIVFRW